MKENQREEAPDILGSTTTLKIVSALAGLLLVGLLVFMVAKPDLFFGLPETTIASEKPAPVPDAPATEAPAALWQAPDIATVPATAEGDAIRYGRELVAHTAKYLGPEGSVLQLSNGMNCQNCHLDAGTKPFGNNYSMVKATYPKLRARSGQVEDIYKRINDCFERSLNGQPLAKDSKEMAAMKVYIEWVGKDVPNETKVNGAGFVDLALLDRAADPVKGKLVYVEKCQVCHGADGEGIKVAGSAEYQFPPMWGKNSYNDGAGLYRISNFAKFAYANMPLGVTHETPQLTPEEAWDVAAFVNSMPRPKKDISKDWPDISKKAFDHPFGPFSDDFSEEQHKYGPYQPIIEAKKNS